MSRHIKIVEAPGVKREIEWTAREIKRIVNSGVADVEDIAVIYRGGAIYPEIISSVFRKFGIPLNIRETVPLSLTSIGKLIIRILSVSRMGYHRDITLELLKTDYHTPFNTSIKTGFIEKYLGELRVIKGKDKWLKAIKKRIEKLEYGASGENANKKELEALKFLLIELKSFFSLLDFPSSATVGSFNSKLMEILKSLQLEENILKGGDIDIISRDINHLHMVTNVLYEMYQLEGDDREITFEDYFENLVQILESMEVRKSFKDVSGVYIMDVMSARGLQFPVVFICGLIEGEFPITHRPNLIFSERERGDLNRKLKGYEIPVSSLSPEEERLLFYIAATGAAGSLYLTYPYLNSSGEDNLPSHFVEEVKYLLSFSGEEREFIERIELSDIVPDFSRCGSEGDLEERIFLNLRQPSSLLEGKIDETMDIARMVSRGDRFKRIAELIKMEDLKRDSETFTSWEGILSHKKILEILDKRYGDSFTYSPAALEDYGHCPFRFFAKRVLDLKPFPPVLEDLLPEERGYIIHRILKELFSSLKNRGKVPLSPDNRDDAADLLGEAVEKTISSISPEFINLEPQFWESEKRRLCSSLKRFINSEISYNEKEGLPFKSAHFELSFGMEPDPDTDVKSVREPLQNYSEECDIKFKGRMDRVDVADDIKFFRIIDYKMSSQIPGNSGIREGINFQFPIYYLAGQKLFFKDYNFESAFFYSLWDMRRKSYFKKFNLVKGIDVEGFRDMVKGSLSFAVKYVQLIRNGDFQVNPKKCVSYCEYGSLCRYDKFAVFE
ncbi:MAG: PD-(D/E)XK nuclease family protein, partial [Fidelibacterota bacterium]